MFSKPGIGANADKPNQWWPYEEGMSTALNSFRVGVMISINTPYFIGSIAACILHQIIPTDMEDPEEIAVEKEWQEYDSDAETDDLLPAAKDIEDPEDPEDPTEPHKAVADEEVLQNEEVSEETGSVEVEAEPEAIKSE